MKKKQLLISLGLIGGLALSGCHSGTNGSNSGLNSAEVKHASNSTVSDSIANYPIGNILKYVTRSNDGTVVTYTPDAENGNGILGFYISNQTQAYASESGIEAGKLTMLVPNSEKAYFAAQERINLAPGETPMRDNPLANDVIKGSGLDFKNGAWQLVESGVDTGTHNMFFSYKDPRTGDDVYFKLVSEVKTSSLDDLEAALSQNQAVSGNDKLQNIYTEQPLKATLVTVAGVLSTVIGTVMLGGPEFKYGVNPLEPGSKMKFFNTVKMFKLARSARSLAGQAYSDFMYYAEMSDWEVQGISWEKIYKETTLDSAKYANLRAAIAYGVETDKYKAGAITALENWQGMLSGSSQAYTIALKRGAMGLMGLGGAGAASWYLSTHASLSATESATSVDAARLLSSGADSTTLTYRQVHLEPVSDADVAKYPELNLKASKSVTPLLQSSFMTDTVGFSSKSNTSDEPSIMVSLEMLDTLFNPKPTKEPNSNPQDISWLKQDGYLGNRMPVTDFFGQGKVNHYLDAAMYLRVMTPATFNNYTIAPALYSQKAAEDAGYKYNGYEGVAPDVSVLSITNSNGDEVKSLKANQEILKTGLSYVNKEGLKIYNAINLQPGDQVKLSLKNTSQSQLVGFTGQIWDLELGLPFPTAQKASRLSQDREMLMAFDGCGSLSANNSCKLTIGAGKLGNDKSFTGFIEVAALGAGQNSTLLPFTYNVKTVLTPSVLDVALGDDEVDGKFINQGTSEIEDIGLDRGDLPEKASLSFKCYTSDNKLVTGNNLPGNKGYCKINVGNLGSVRSGTYHMSITSNGVTIQTVPVQL